MRRMIFWSKFRTCVDAVELQTDDDAELKTNRSLGSSMLVVMEEKTCGTTALLILLS